MACQKCNDQGVIIEKGRVPVVCEECLNKRTPVILFRPSLEVEEEYRICQKYFPRYTYRSKLQPRSLVIPRYSALPFYRELETEVKLLGSRLINTYQQHRYVADIANYYQDIRGLTPETWFNWTDLPEGSFVLKGRTNSRKHQWQYQMFAPTREQVFRIANRLLDDTFIRDQGLCVRKYIPLKQFDVGINGLPITNEWRVFMLGDQLIAIDYYWSDHPQYRTELPADSPAFDLIKKVATLVKDNINFYVIDIAETEEGEWIVIELNDGSMSGLSSIPPDTLYGNLKRCLDAKW